ncbi:MULTISPECIES: WXG100 family type VII secretion target [Janibacter]|jgi:WXG100 family type VII secretion target|uniref:WXG100 family type VII secretion target n=1 Tax=Janibacter TaxID=53457 RepID=UPI00082A30A4|nr:WXG100 family type VII secretion target [Janibacter terrae]MBA4084218.1 WXG100 family type VII secretion target [Kytococcus sp.]HCE60407.1 WXG100 family type VII secretion target [Janibacter terrae]
MATFTVNTEQVASSSTDVARISEDVETTVASMMSRLISLQDEWQGDASTSFQDLINDWRATQRTVKESLDEISRALGEASESYSTTETGVKGMMRPGR